MSRKRIVRIGILAVSMLLSYRIIASVCETYFFDQLIYYKSTAFGYWVPGKNLTLSDFGRRGKDHSQLLSAVFASGDEQDVLGAREDRDITIALIGDSVAWGQGVRFEETVSRQLEKKLSAIKKTNVLLYAGAGDDAADNLAKYDLLRHLERIDLYIFMVSPNDILFNETRKYSGDRFGSMRDDCLRETGMQIVMAPQWSLDRDFNERYGTLMEEAHNNATNRCVFARIYDLHPREQAIYVFINESEKNTNDFPEIFSQRGVLVLHGTDGKNLPGYKKHWEDPKRYFRISRLETHPSKDAHSMYADLLFNAIISMPSLGY